MLTEPDVREEERAGEGGGHSGSGTGCRGRTFRLHDVHWSFPGDYREDLLPSGEPAFPCILTHQKPAMSYFYRVRCETGFGCMRRSLVHFYPVFRQGRREIITGVSGVIRAYKKKACVLAYTGVPFRSTFYGGLLFGRLKQFGIMVERPK